jgi:hypothetical protein
MLPAGIEPMTTKWNWKYHENSSLHYPPLVGEWEEVGGGDEMTMMMEEG